jgi:hypothetical protein
MEEKDKLGLLIDMTEHPENYTDEQLQKLLEDEECRELYNIIADVDSTLMPQMEDDTEQSLQRFEKDMHRHHSFRNIAAIGIGVLMISGLVIAAIVTQIGRSERSGKGQQTERPYASIKAEKASPSVIQTDSGTEKKPYWRFANTGNVILRRVVRSDTATILTFHIKTWSWRLRDEAVLQAGGKSYRLKWKKELQAQDSLVACFEPLPHGVETFDFIEGDDFNAWCIYGIRSGRPYPAAMPQRTEPVAVLRGNEVSLGEVGRIYREVPLMNFEPRCDTAVVRGRIVGFDRRIMNGFSWILYTNPLTGAIDDKMCMDTLGNFEYKAYLPAPYKAAFSVAGINFEPLMVPGDTTRIDIDIQAYTNAQIDERSDTFSLRREGITLRGVYAPYEAVMRTWRQKSYPISSLAQDSSLSFNIYAERVWSDYLQRKKETERRRDLTELQRNFALLYCQANYLKQYYSYDSYIWLVYKVGLSVSDSLARAKEKEAVGRIIPRDPHANELPLIRTMLAPYFLSDAEKWVPYMEANGLTDNPFYRWLMDFKKKKTIAP